jgi:hypothetical protein
VVFVFARFNPLGEVSLMADFLIGLAFLGILFSPVIAAKLVNWNRPPDDDL